MVGITFYGIWIGGQKHAEEIYLNNSVDKNMIPETEKLIKLAEHIATTIGAVFSLVFLLVSLDSFTQINGLAKSLKRLDMKDLILDDGSKVV